MHVGFFGKSTIASFGALRVKVNIGKMENMSISIDNVIAMVEERSVTCDYCLQNVPKQVKLVINQYK